MTISARSQILAAVSGTTDLMTHKNSP